MSAASGFLHHPRTDPLDVSEKNLDSGFKHHYSILLYSEYKTFEKCFNPTQTYQSMSIPQTQSNKSKKLQSWKIRLNA